MLTWYGKAYDAHMPAGVPGTNDAASDPTDRRRPAVPIGWGRVPGHEVAFCDRLPFLLTTEVNVLQSHLKTRSDP